MAYTCALVAIALSTISKKGFRQSACDDAGFRSFLGVDENAVEDEASELNQIVSDVMMTLMMVLKMMTMMMIDDADFVDVDNYDDR